MKRLIPLLVIVPLVLACRKAPAPAAAAQAAAATPNGQPAGVAGQPAAVKPVPAQLPELLAKVNGEPVDRAELERALKGIEARAGSPVPPDKRDEVLRGLLDQIITFRVLAAEATTLKLAVTDADVEARLAQIKQNFPNAQAFEQALAAQGLTLDQLQRQTRMSLAVSKVIDAEVTSKLSVADADVDAFYAKNPDQFKEGETVHASHILFSAPQTASPAEKQQARAKAEQALKAIRAGADFATIAREQSQDPGSAKNGGDLGFFPKGQMDPKFEAAAFALKPGTVSGIVETPFGFHIIKVVERRPPRTMPLAEVSAQIKQYLTQQQRETMLNAFVEQAKAKAKIEIFI